MASVIVFLRPRLSVVNLLFFAGRGGNCPSLSTSRFTPAVGTFIDGLGSAVGSALLTGLELRKGSTLLDGVTAAGNAKRLSTAVAVSAERRPPIAFFSPMERDL